MSALEFLGELSVHLPDRGSHGVLFYGRHSRRSRGERARAEAVAEGASAASSPPSRLTPEQDEDDLHADPTFLQKRKAFRRSWSQLLKKVWNVDAMRCPRCTSRMKVVSAITDVSIAKRILRHLGLFDEPRPPNAHDCTLKDPAATGATLFLWPEPSPRHTPRNPQADPPGIEDAGEEGAHSDWPGDPPFNED